MMGEDSVQLVLRLLKDALDGSGIKQFYDGDPDLIPEFNLPCIVVEQLTDETVGGTFREDDVRDTVLVKVIFNKKDDWTNDVDPTNTTHTKIRKLIGGRDLQSGDYLPGTVKGALRPELYGQRRIGSEMSVELGVLPRPEELITAEGHVTVKVDYSVDVSVN